MNGIKFWFCHVFIIYSTINVWCQSRNITEGRQTWIGYISSVTFHEKMSLWNDFHYVPTAFVLCRHGASVHITPDIIFTGGFAWLRLGVPALQGLTRREYRPWGQMNVHLKATEKISINHRIRYDWRLREEYGIDDAGQFEGFNEYVGIHRIRFMTSVRFPIVGIVLGSKIPFMSINNELLINFGRNIVWNYFDQNRLWVNVGYQYKKTTFQIGYMMRFVQLSTPGYMALYHTPLLWITQALDMRIRKREEKSTENLLHREQ